MIKFYDTSSLLLIKDIFKQKKPEDNIMISSITLKELEHIKTSANKDANVKYQARQLLHLLNNNLDKFSCLIYTSELEQYIKALNLELTNDSKILATAIKCYEDNPNQSFEFITNDLSLHMLALLYFDSDQVQSYVNNSDIDDYKGYVKISLNDEDMANFYSNPNEYQKRLQLNINEYLNIYDTSNTCVDTLCWTGEGFRPLKYKTFSSQQLGNIKPYKNDIYQAMAADSFLHNKITIIKGPAGTGKSHLALGYLFSLLDHNKIDKIIIFCNTVATKNSARLGFYPGSKDEKLLDSQIGNFLASKLGGLMAVEHLIENEKLILLPMSDIRGYDTSGMNAGIYITEAQNLDVELLKLALQRVGDDSIVILDGDVKSQVDLIDYEGNNNGLRRASEVFRGQDFYGEIELKQIHRSKIAEIANLM